MSPPEKNEETLDNARMLEYAVIHDDEEEAERIREELRRLTDEV